MRDSNNLNILACPNCQQPLHNTSKCDLCGLEFDEDGGTPILIGKNISRTISLDFNSSRSVVKEDLLRKILQDPPISSSSQSLPHHMDPAHVNVINVMKSGGSVLEIGCGGGQNRRFFMDMGFDYTGVDISKTRVFDWLQSFGGPDYLCDAHFLPFLSQKFDLVYCAAVFEHLSSPFLAAQEIYRVLKPGGYFLGNVSFLEPWHDDSFFHMTPLGVAELLTHPDFEIQYLWPGRGYSGYKAMAAMGSRLTEAFQWYGSAVYALYRIEQKIKANRRREEHPEFKDILNRAKVAGAIDWIAQRPDN